MFKGGFYLEALKENEIFSSDVKIGEQVKNQLLFKYGEVEKQQFNLKYSTGGWLGRKITALPRFVWFGVVPLTYHLALAILIGVPKVCLGDREYLKVQLYNVARDLQETYGYLFCLINDRHGQFHIQESQFQKSCYRYFLTDDLIKKEKVIPFSPPKKEKEVILPKLEEEIIVLNEDLIQWLLANRFSPEENQQVSQFLISEDIKSLEDLSALSKEKISSLKDTMNRLEKRRFEKGLEALKQSSSPIVNQELPSPSSKKMEDSFEDSDEHVLRADQDLSLEELLLEYKNEIVGLDALFGVLCEDQNQKAEKRLIRSKDDRRERAERLEHLIRSKGGGA